MDQAVEKIESPVTRTSQDLLGQRLIRAGLITQSQVDLILTQQRHGLSLGRRIRFGELVVRLGFATQLQVERVASGEESVTSVAYLLPDELLHRHRIHPVRVDGDTLVIEVSHKLHEVVLAEILQMAQEVQPKIAHLEQVPANRVSAIVRARSLGGKDSLERTLAELNRSPSDGVRLQAALDQMLTRAIGNRASDIHIERAADDLDCWISYRVDGDRRPTFLLTREVAAAIVTRIKSEAGMDPSARHAQDGRFAFAAAGRKVDVRVATEVVEGGEMMTMRLLDPTTLKRLHELFPYQPELAKWLKTLANKDGKSGGILLVTGATGSGKTTTLQAFMQEIPRDRKNVTSVEDPVEYKLPLTRQVPVNAAIGRTFSSVLRALMRQDPDVIVIGELRDGETAEIGLRAAESGHLMCSTLHTVDVLQALERLLGLLDTDDRGLARFTLAGYLSGIINQRLVKLLCDCANTVNPATLAPFTGVIEALGLQDEDLPNLRVHNPHGCARCSHTGYYDRCAVPEAMLFNGGDEMRDAMARMLGNSEPLRGMIRLDGVRYFSRAASLAPLVADGRVELRQAADMLSIEVGNE